MAERRAPSLDDEELAIGRVVADKYEIEALLGEGGMGSVWAAKNVRTKKPVAIKALRTTGGAASPVARERLLREARTAGSIRHPNVVDVYDVIDDGHAPLLVMERLEGEPLSAVLARGTLPLDDALRILVPAMRGVAAAHERGVVHRDLKPDNIFLVRNEAGELRDVKVLDFGISKVAEDPLVDGKGALTQSGTILGTPMYMAPEQLQAKPVDARTDVYALGVILFEAITGTLPHDGETFALMASAKLREAPRSARKLVPDLPRAAEKAIERALANDPEDRFPNIASFAHALEPFTMAEFGTTLLRLSSETGRGAVRDVRARSRRTTLLVGLALLAALALTGAAAAAVIFDEAGTPPAPQIDSVPVPVAVAVPESASESAPASESVTATATATATTTTTDSDSDSDSGSDSDADSDSPSDPHPRTQSRRGRTGRIRWSDF